MGVVLSEPAPFSPAQAISGVLPMASAKVDVVDINLNMLVTLDVLLQTRCVTEAAHKMGRTQSAVSHTLAKLRDLFGDDLLVRAGRRMALTPKARAMAPMIRGIVAAIEQLVTLDGIHG